MNPILKNKRNTAIYALIILLFSAIYTTVFAIGTDTGAGAIIVDAIVFCVVYGLEGIVLWNILRYALPEQTGKVEGLVIAATGVIIAAVSIGAETVATYAAAPDSFVQFAVTIPQRALVVLLAYSVTTMWHLKHIMQSTAEQTYNQTAEPERQIVDHSKIDRITLRAGQKIKIIGIREIEYIKAEGDYVGIVTAEGRWLKEWTMKYLEENLPVDSFVRIHRSYIVALSNITRIERVGKLYQVVLRNGEEVRVSPTGYKLLKEKMKL